MHPEPLINPEDHTRIARDTADRALDARIVRALEEFPRVQIPTDFAARVASRIPAHTARLRSARIQSRRFGYTIAAACLIVLAVAMLAVAPRASHNTFWIVMECTLCAQFCLLAAWLGMPRRE
jgi:hypothetical protein